jgi:hypothetical protein
MKDGMDHSKMLEELLAEYPSVKEEVEALQGALDEAMPMDGLDAEPMDEDMDMAELPPLPMMGMDGEEEEEDEFDDEI